MSTKQHNQDTVIISKNQNRYCYHTRPDCHMVDRIPEREVSADSPLVMELDHCGHCENLETGDYNSSQPERECPVCHELVGRLRDHLPCDGDSSGGML